MVIIVLGVCVVVPLAAGFSSGWWFWRIPYIKSLRERAREFDNYTASVAQHMSVEQLRLTERLGDRICVSHHLADWATDLAEDLFFYMSVSAGLAAMVTVGICTVLQAQAQAQAQARGVLPTGGEFLDQLIEVGSNSVMMQLPLGCWLPMLFLLVEVLCLWKQSRRFRSVLVLPR